MIYEIDYQYIVQAMNAGMNLVCVSHDGSRILFSGDNGQIPVEYEYQDSELSALMATEFWRQPCKDCD